RILGANRQYPHAAVRQRCRQSRSASCVLAVRRLSGGLSREDQHPAHADRLARAATRRERGREGTPGAARKVVGAAGLAAGARDPESAVAVPAGAALRAVLPADRVKGRLALSDAGARSWLDAGTRLPGAGGTLVPREME